MSPGDPRPVLGAPLDPVHAAPSLCPVRCANVVYYWRPDNYVRDRRFGFGYPLRQNPPALAGPTRGETVWAFTRDRRLLSATWLAALIHRGREPRVSMNLQELEVLRQSGSNASVSVVLSSDSFPFSPAVS